MLGNHNRSKKFKQSAVFFIFFYGIFCFLSLNRHSKADVFDYHSEIFADKAGYYIYLPALFIYDFQAKKLPSQIDKKTGYGFKIDTTVNKIGTKYTYGVALLQAPFFMVTHLLAKSLGYRNDGFSIIYNKMINVAAVFYSDLAVIFLYFFLLRYVSKNIALIALSGIFLGTNVFYYSIFETGMSHIYSFFLFSVYLFLSDRLFKPKQSIFFYILFGFVTGLILMVRQLNLIFLPVIFMFNKFNYRGIKNLINPFLIIACTVAIVVIPQLLYWRYLSGNYFMYSYPNERFTNLLSPRILHILFSPNNGLFLYNPLFLFILFGLIIARKIYFRWSLFLSLYFLFLAYLFSSWWDWHYGCSYGSRPFVEFYTLFSLPFCFFIQYLLKNKRRTYLFGFIVLLCIGWNLKLIFSYDGCWLHGNWDWQEFGRFIVSPTK